MWYKKVRADLLALFLYIKKPERQIAQVVFTTRGDIAASMSFATGDNSGTLAHKKA